MSFQTFLKSTLVAGVVTSVFATTAFADTTTTYVSGSTDTFWNLSKKFHVSVSALEAANPNVNPKNVYQGLTLHIPGGKSAFKPTTTAHSTSVVKVHGVSKTYSKVLSCRATAYTASEASNLWGPVDYFGNPLKVGTVAVDPSVIPLGSTLYVTGYNFAKLPVGGMICHATDEGGKIKGKRIDMFIPTSQAVASNFGVQNVKVYVLK